MSVAFSVSRYSRTIATLVGSALILAGCGGGGGSSSASTSAATPELATNDKEKALSASRPGELVEFVKTTLRARQSARAVEPSVAFDGGPLTISAVTSLAGGAAAAAPQQSMSLTQEAGVGEADLITSDGRYLYTLQPDTASGNRLEAYRRADDGSITRSASLPLPSPSDTVVSTTGMYPSVDAKKLVVVTP